MNPMGWNVGDVVELTAKDNLEKYLAEGKVVEYIPPMTDDEKKKKWLEELVESGAVKLNTPEPKAEVKLPVNKK